MNPFLNDDDFPVFCENVPDYRKDAFEEAKKTAKTFGFAYVMHNGLYYHITASEHSRIYWECKGYKLIHVERK